MAKKTTKKKTKKKAKKKKAKRAGKPKASRGRPARKKSPKKRKVAKRKAAPKKKRKVAKKKTKPARKKVAKKKRRAVKKKAKPAAKRVAKKKRKIAKKKIAKRKGPARRKPVAKRRPVSRARAAAAAPAPVEAPAPTQAKATAAPPRPKEAPSARATPVVPEAPSAPVAAPQRSAVVYGGPPEGATAAASAPAVGRARPASPFSVDLRPDGEAFINCIRRRGTPARVHFAELFLDGEVQEELCRRFGILDRLDPADEFFPLRRQIAIQRFLGYDYVVAGLEGLDMPMSNISTEDTAALARSGGRSFVDEHKGPITTMEEYERYPWPDPEKLTSRALEWYERNLPDDMCVIGGLCGHFAENLSWLMGYETLCFALYEDRDLVGAIARRTLQIDREVVKRLCQFDRVKAVWGSDDMGYRSGTLIGPDDMREFVLKGHRVLASFAHMHGRAYLLHSCGNLSEIMEELIGSVRIDAKHSFEDTIEDVRDAKRKWGDRIALLGGIDVDFLCRADEDAIRMRVRSTLSTCQRGGGYCLGTGNTVANYVPVDNYLAMLDEGRKFGR